MISYRQSLNGPAERLAEAIRHKLRGQDILHPLPPKILVPALEGASLEDPDSPLIGWWAELLAKGVATGEIRPFLIDLMTKIGNEEAALLDEFWSRFAVSKTGLWRKLGSNKQGPAETDSVRNYFKGYIEANIDGVRKQGAMTDSEFREHSCVWLVEQSDTAMRSE